MIDWRCSSNGVKPKAYAAITAESLCCSFARNSFPPKNQADVTELLQKNVAFIGHKYSILCSRAYRLIKSKAFSASTSSIASVLFDSSVPCIGCIAALHPALWPAHNCKHPAAFVMSSFTTFITIFPAIRRRALPTSIGRNPGFLSREMGLQAKGTSSDVSYLVVPTGTFTEHIFLMILANALLKAALIVL